jgi:hypothetical protein
MCFRRSRCPPPLSITQEVGRGREQVRFHVLDGSQTALIGQSDEDLLDQVLVLSLPADSPLEKAQQGNPKPSRQGLENLISPPEDVGGLSRV